MKFTSRDMSLKRTPSKKQTGVFGVKISVVTKYVRGWGGLICSGPCGCGVAPCPLIPTNTGELSFCSLLRSRLFLRHPHPSHLACPSCPWAQGLQG